MPISPLSLDQRPGLDVYEYISNEHFRLSGPEHIPADSTALEEHSLTLDALSHVLSVVQGESNRRQTAEETVNGVEAWQQRLESRARDGHVLPGRLANDSFRRAVFTIVDDLRANMTLGPERKKLEALAMKVAGENPESTEIYLSPKDGRPSHLGPGRGSYNGINDVINPIERADRSVQHGEILAILPVVRTTYRDVKKGFRTVQETSYEPTGSFTIAYRHSPPTGQLPGLTRGNGYAGFRKNITEETAREVLAAVADNPEAGDVIFAAVFATLPNHENHAEDFQAARRPSETDSGLFVLNGMNMVNSPGSLAAIATNNTFVPHGAYRSKMVNSR